MRLFGLTSLVRRALLGFILLKNLAVAYRVGLTVYGLYHLVNPLIVAELINIFNLVLHLFLIRLIILKKGYCFFHRNM